jgi:hypothetical protein
MIAMVAGDQRPGAWLAGLAVMPDGGDPSGGTQAGLTEGAEPQRWHTAGAPTPAVAHRRGWLRAPNPSGVPSAGFWPPLPGQTTDNRLPGMTQVNKESLV